MKYYKDICDGYIVAILTGGNGTSYEISETEYNAVLNLIYNKPTAPEGFDYQLKNATLEWELYELPPVPEDDEITAEEALEIITGGYAE